MKTCFIFVVALLHIGIYSHNIIENNFLTELPNAHFNAYNSDQNDVAWMVNDGRIYVITGGFADDFSNIYLLEFDPYKNILAPVPGGIPLEAQFGTDVLGRVRSFCSTPFG